MQPSFTRSEAFSESARPRRLVQHPPYLSDYEVSFVGHRQATITPSYAQTAQYAPGLGEDYRSTSGAFSSAVPDHFSRSSSPLSQVGCDFTLDEWTLSPHESREPDYQPVGASGGRSYLTPQSNPSTYHRPWETSAAPHWPRSVDFRHPPHALPSRPERDYHLPQPAELRPPPIQLPPLTPIQYGQLGSVPTVPHQCEVRPGTGRSQSMQHDNTQYIDAPQGYQRSYALTPQAQSGSFKETMMLDTLDKMMGELRLLKEQTLAASASQPPSTTANRGPLPQFARPPLSYYDQRPLLQSQPASNTYLGYQNPLPMQPWDQQPTCITPRPVTTPLQYEPHLLRPYNQQRTISDMPSRPQPYVAAPERTYRGPTPTIPNLNKKDPGEFARLKIALDNLLPLDGTELFKFQILMDHLKLDEARLIADAYLNSQTPYTDTMAALSEKFGQPHQLAIKKIASVMDASDIRRGDAEAFERFALQIRALVGMLKTLGQDGEVES